MSLQLLKGTHSIFLKSWVALSFGALQIFLQLIILFNYNLIYAKTIVRELCMSRRNRAAYVPVWAYKFIVWFHLRISFSFMHRFFGNMYSLINLITFMTDIYRLSDEVQSIISWIVLMKQYDRLLFSEDRWNTIHFEIMHNNFRRHIAIHETKKTYRHYLKSISVSFLYLFEIEIWLVIFFNLITQNSRYILSCRLPDKKSVILMWGRNITLSEWLARMYVSIYLHTYYFMGLNDVINLAVHRLEWVKSVLAFFLEKFYYRDRAPSRSNTCSILPGDLYFWGI